MEQSPVQDDGLTKVERRLIDSIAQGILLDLTAVNVGPQMVPAAQWDAFKTGGDTAALDNIRGQIEGETDPHLQ